MYVEIDSSVPLLSLQKNKTLVLMLQGELSLISFYTKYTILYFKFFKVPDFINFFFGTSREKL